MKRWRASLPRFRTPIIVQRYQDGPASGTGNQTQGSQVARVLKRFVTVSPSGIDLPSVPAPANHAVPPSIYASGWTAWWPEPPASVSKEYVIPDPPRIPRPVLPTSEAPILWEAYATVGTNVWEARISAVYLRCEWQPKTGREMMSGEMELDVQMGALKVRPGIIKSAGITSRDWNVLRVEDDNEVWQLESVTPSFRRGEFAELMVVNTGR